MKLQFERSFQRCNEDTKCYMPQTVVDNRQISWENHLKARYVSVISTRNRGERLCSCNFKFHAFQRSADRAAFGNHCSAHLCIEHTLLQAASPGLVCYYLLVN
eukprot:scpid64464/ scgid33748/ 